MLWAVGVIAALWMGYLLYCIVFAGWRRRSKREKRWAVGFLVWAIGFFVIPYPASLLGRQVGTAVVYAWFCVPLLVYGWDLIRLATGMEERERRALEEADMEARRRLFETNHRLQDKVDHASERN